MKLVFFIKALVNSGGTERVLTNKANHLVSNGYEVTIITTEQKDSEISFYRLNDKVNLIHLNLGFEKKRSLFIVFRLFVHIYKLYKFKYQVKHILNKIKPDIATSLAGYEVSFLYKLKKCNAFFLEIHFNKGFRYELLRRRPNVGKLKLLIGKLNSFWLEQNAKHYDKLITITNSDNRLWGDEFNIVTIPNSLSYIPEQMSTLDTKKIIAVGRFAPEKGFDSLLAIWKSIEDTDSYNDWTLHLYGDGEYKSDYLYYIQRHQMKQVVIHDAVTNIYDKYLDSDIFVSSSNYEPFGMTIIEAMSCGLPVVAFDCDFGPREILDDKSGFLIPLGDDQKFLESLIVLMQSKILRIEMGTYARSITRKKYDSKLILKQWEELYNEQSKL